MVKVVLGIGAGALVGYVIAKALESPSTCPPPMPCPTVPQSVQDVFTKYEQQKLLLAQLRDLVSKIPGGSLVLAKVGL